MSSLNTKLSVVLPVRDGESRITRRVETVLEALADLSREISEVIVVDDGSKDATPEVLDELKTRYRQLRIIRHSRPRGFEASGQSGLERAIGDLVFIQETDTDPRIEDIRRLLRMSEDKSVVAARAESTPRPLSGALLRRLKAWGSKVGDSLPVDSLAKSSLQMIRRPHLQTLASSQGSRYQLQGETMHSTTVEEV